MIALLVVCYWVLSKEVAEPLHRHEYQQYPKDSSTAGDSTSTWTGGAGPWTVAFAYYCLLIHLFVFIFPLRACWAIWDLTRSLKKVRAKTMRGLEPNLPRRDSLTSLSSSETLTSTSSAESSIPGSEAGDMETELYHADTGLLVHAIVIPNYKEELDTLRETLDVLASHLEACLSYDVSRFISTCFLLLDAGPSLQPCSYPPRCNWFFRHTRFC